LGSKFFIEKANTLLRAEMGRKPKLSKYHRMPTEGKYWEVIPKIVIHFLVLNAAKSHLCYFGRTLLPSLVVQGGTVLPNPWCQWHHQLLSLGAFKVLLYKTYLWTNDN